MATFGMFLLSKEYYVLEHEFWSGAGVALTVALLANKAGPYVTEMIDGEQAKEHEKLTSARTNEIER